MNTLITPVQVEYTWDSGFDVTSYVGSLMKEQRNPFVLPGAKGGSDSSFVRLDQWVESELYLSVLRSSDVPRVGKNMTRLYAECWGYVADGTRNQVRSLLEDAVDFASAGCDSLVIVGVDPLVSTPMLQVAVHSPNDVQISSQVLYFASDTANNDH